jgi:signal transduction histidine kinase
VAEKRESADSFSGVGLKSIFNRAKLIGAQLRIDSKPGEGTRVLIELPLQEAV